MTPGEVELARRFAFALFKLRPWKLRSFEMTQSLPDVPNEVIGHDLIAKIGNASEFCAASDIRAFVEWIKTEDADFMNEE